METRQFRLVTSTQTCAYVHQLSLVHIRIFFLPSCSPISSIDRRPDGKHALMTTIQFSMEDFEKGMIV